MYQFSKTSIFSHNSRENNNFIINSMSNLFLFIVSFLCTAVISVLNIALQDEKYKKINILITSILLFLVLGISITLYNRDSDDAEKLANNVIKANENLEKLTSITIPTIEDQVSEFQNKIESTLSIIDESIDETMSLTEKSRKEIKKNLNSLSKSFNKEERKLDFDRLYQLYSDRFFVEFDALHKSIHEYAIADKLKDTKKMISLTSDIANKELFIRKTYSELQNQFEYFIQNESHLKSKHEKLKTLMRAFTSQFDKVFDPTTCCNMTKMISEKKGNELYETKDFELLVKLGESLMHQMGEERRNI